MVESLSFLAKDILDFLNGRMFGLTIGNIDDCIAVLNDLIKNLNEIYNNYSQENYTNMFMKYHGPKIGEIMEKLGQKEEEET